jgi:hypothetical protein
MEAMMRTRYLLLAAVVLIVVASVAGILCVAHGSAYRKAGMTHAVVIAPAKNPNRVIFESGRTLGLWTCQDSFRVGVGSTYKFVPWFKSGSTLKAMIGWRYQVLPMEGACRVTAYVHGAAIADTIALVCSPDSAVTSISDGTLIDSLMIRGLVLCKGHVRAQ